MADFDIPPDRVATLGEILSSNNDMLYLELGTLCMMYPDVSHEQIFCLLQALFRSFVITIEQMRAGFQRVYDQMVDNSIDSINLIAPGLFCA